MGRQARKDPELDRRIQQKRLEKYRNLKQYARLQGDEELFQFSARKERLMLKMLQDEYDVISSGAPQGRRHEK